MYRDSGRSGDESVYVVTVVAECPGWDADRQREFVEALRHLRPKCGALGDKIMMRFCVRGRNHVKACALVKRRLQVHAALREWRSFRVATCSAIRLEQMRPPWHY